MISENTIPQSLEEMLSDPIQHHSLKFPQHARLSFSVQLKELVSLTKIQHIYLTVAGNLGLEVAVTYQQITTLSGSLHQSTLKVSGLLSIIDLLLREVILQVDLDLSSAKKEITREGSNTNLQLTLNKSQEHNYDGLSQTYKIEVQLQKSVRKTSINDHLYESQKSISDWPKNLESNFSKSKLDKKGTLELASTRITLANLFHKFEGANLHQFEGHSIELDHSNDNLRFNILKNTILQTLIAPTNSNLNVSTPQIQISEGVIYDQRDHLAKQNESECTFTVRVDQVCFDQISIRELGNLFSNYGNINYSLYNVEAKLCLFYFVSLQGATFTIQNLDGLRIENISIRVTLIPPEFVYSIERQQTLLKYAPKKRFSSKGEGVPNRVNPVSRTLHVTFYHEYEDKQLGDNVIGWELSHYGYPIRIKREISKQKRNMWFVEFSDVTTAVLVLMKEHNKPLLGGNIRISFTKTL